MEPHDQEDLVSIKDIRVMLGRASKRGETVARNYAQFVSREKTFPEPFAVLPHIRLWRRSEVEAWMDKNKPAWRNRPAEDEPES